VTAVALDSSSLIRHLNGRQGSDTAAVKSALDAGTAVVPPLVVTEVLSLPGVTPEVRRLLTVFPRLELLPEYWERAGYLRARVIEGGRRARTADVLIAQSCLDHDVPLITADSDFQHFVPHGLRLVLP
jgi:predicted nucleic acid-binding protein